VEFGERDLNTDFGPAEHSIREEEMSHPIIADPFGDSASYFVLGKDYIPTHGRPRSVFVVLSNNIGSGCAVAQHLEDDHQITDDGALDWQRGADDEAKGIADFAGNLDLKVVPDKLAGLAAEPDHVIDMFKSAL
jgi:hypothetical protein